MAGLSRAKPGGTVGAACGSAGEGTPGAACGCAGAGAPGAARGRAGAGAPGAARGSAEVGAPGAAHGSAEDGVPIDPGTKGVGAGGGGPAGKRVCDGPIGTGTMSVESSKKSYA